MTGPRTLTVSEAAARLEVMAQNLGRCVLCGDRASNYAHRWAVGRGGPTTVANGLALCGSGTTGCHGLTGRRQGLSRRCGWMLDTDTDPRTVPALITFSGIPGWWFLDAHEGSARVADAGEVPAWMWQGTFAEAVAELGVTR